MFQEFAQKSFIVMLLSFCFTFLASASFASSITPSPAGPCQRNSDCLRGLICSNTGTCIAECKEDVDCAAQGIAHKCMNTLRKDLDMSANLGGGANAYQCVPRGELAPMPPLSKVYKEMTNTEISGETFWSFANIFEDPQVCARECAKHQETCRAWMMIKANLHGPFARCYLKKSIGETSNNGGAVSGVLM